jgi:hypothetical protein
MWPPSIASSPQRDRRSSSGPCVEGHSTPLPSGQGDIIGLFQHAAPVVPPGIDLLFENLPGTSQFEIPSANPEEDLLYRFERDLSSPLSDFDCGDDGHLAQKGNDPKENNYFVDPNEPIPWYNQSLHSYPPNQAITLPLPAPTSPTRGRRPFEFQITDKLPDCAATNLQNTPMFLSVSVFAKDTSECFYLLSGSGKTAAHSRTGSAHASQRSKTERKLRKTVFGPLKKTGTDNTSSLALLAVAKKFVVLGLLWTGEEVLDYLFKISKVSCFGKTKTLRGGG